MKLDERFWENVVVGTPNECWSWLRGVGTHGYGYLRIGGKYMLAHRVAFSLVKGSIPNGKEIDPLCRNHICVNPNHLEAVTHRENILRGYTIPAFMAAQVTCQRGHQYNEENTLFWGTRRECRVCQRLHYMMRVGHHPRAYQRVNVAS